jgi:uncharacterized protein involved in outer membrane biogenesis
MRLKTIAIAATAVVVGLVVTAVAIVSTMDFNQYRGTIADRVKQATGRDLAINGDLKLALGLSPAVAVNDVTFANAPWGSRPHMAQVKRFEAQVELLPLVFGNINVKRIVLNDADILLETDAQGRGNWEFVARAAQEATQPKPEQPSERGAITLPAVHEVDIRNARLAYRDGKTGQTTNLNLRHATLGAASPADPLKLDIDGAFNDLAFQAAGRVGSIQALSRPGTPAPVSISGKIADAATFKVDGIIREPLAGKGYELTVAAEGAEISRLARIGGMQMTPVGPFKVEAKVADSAPGGKPSLPAFKAELGKTDLALIKAEGAVRDPLGQKGINLNASVEGNEIGAFSGFGVPGLAAPLPPIPALGPFKATAQVTDGPGDRPSVPQLKAELGRPDLLKVNVDGAIQDPLGRKGINLNIVAEAAELRAVAQKAGVEAPISGPLSLAAKVADAGPDRYALSGVKLKAGNSDLSGDATLAMGGPRPAITANFASTQIDLAAFMAPRDAKAGTAVAPGPASAGGAATGGRMFSDDPLPFDLLNTSDGEVRYHAAKILAKGTTVGDLKMNAVWRNGEFSLKPLTGDLTGGKFAVEMGAKAGAHSMAGKIDVKGVELGTLLQQTGTSDMLRRGKTSFTLDFRGEGRSMRALMASLDGVSTMHVDEGALESRFINLLGADVVRVLSPLQDGGPQTSLNCVVSRFEIKDGVATPKVMFVDTGKMTISGDGNINLGTEQLALMLTPRPKQASLVSLAIPIRVGGTLAAPSFAPDTGAALRGAAGAAAGTVLLGPAGVIVPFLSGGQGGASADLCGQALAQAGLRGTASGQPQQRTPSQTQQQQQPAGPVEGIGRGLRGLFGQ